jgi:hypothetical protein
LAEKFRQLRPGGRLEIRDVLGPEDGDATVFLWCSADDGENPGPAEIAAEKRRDKGWLQSLSTRARFYLFARDFLPTGTGFEFKETQQAGRPLFELELRQAAEFLSKKDYTDNWKSEMNEEFCFWSFSRWKEILVDTGFQVLENVNDAASGSRAYVNPWIVQNRYEGHVSILDAEGAKMPWPPTNMVLVAEKPVG